MSELVAKNYPLIVGAIISIPDFENYIRLIEEKSQEVNDDLQNLEYILTSHTISQTYNFLPRFISLL